MTSIPKITPNKKKAIFLVKRHLPEFVYDAVNLEGIHYTLPEIQTLLDRVTVGGYKISDENITMNQAKAWSTLFELIESNQFTLSKTIACQLHEVAGCEESLEWGTFRIGGVTIAGTTYMPPKAQELVEFNELMLAFYPSGDTQPMTAFMLSCIDERMINIINE